MVSSLFFRVSSHSHDEIQAGMKSLEWTSFFTIDSSFWSFSSLAIYLGAGWDKKTMIYKVGRTSPTQIKGNPNKSKSNKMGSGMFSRNTRSPRKSLCPAEQPSQYSAWEQGAGSSLLFSVWSLTGLQDSPESFARPKDQTPYIEILTHPWNSPLASKLPLLSWTWNQAVSGDFCKHISSSGSPWSTPHKTAPK